MTEQSLVRFTPSLGKVLDEWRMAQLDTPTRADAIRRLAAKALQDQGYRLPALVAKADKPKGPKR